MLFVTLVVAIGLLGFNRLFALCRRVQWRNDLGDNFPTACGSWAEADGCTRIELSNDQCVRSSEIPSENSIVFPATESDALSNFYTKLDTCIGDLSGAKLMSPKDLSSQDYEVQIHVTVNSKALGFIDDMYMIVSPYQDG